MTRRSRYLIAFGLLHIALGFAVLAQAPSPENVVSAAIGQVVPPPVYGPASIFGGLVVIFIGLLPQRWRWKPHAKKFAFGLLSVLLIARVLAHGWAAFLGLSSPETLFAAGLSSVGGRINPGQQVATAAVYMVVVYVHLLVAAWPEPPQMRPLTAYDLDPVRFTEDAVRVMAERLLADDAMAARDRRQLETDLTEIAQYGRLLTREERMTQAEDPEGRSRGRRESQADERAALHEGEETS